MSNMRENIIVHCRGLQKELREISKEYPKYGEDRHIICIKEFRDGFNPYASNTTNNREHFYT